ncbi:MAG: ABC transporter ATP-binding protein, partial [Gammaproteobacteria bacterium]|nr:ABC transporter ATP-binding protein [Gammaproteobacteria bacterium]
MWKKQPMTNPQLQLINITRAYQVGEEKVFALNQVNLKVYPGDYISIMGPSGSGKSTLLNVIGLLDKPDSGDYLLNNKNVTSLTEEEQADVRQQTIGFVFQSFHLVPRLSAQENIELPMTLAGIP